MELLRLLSLVQRKIALEDFKSFFACLQATYPFPREIGITTGVFTPQKKKTNFSIMDFFRKCDQIRRQHWHSYLLKKSLMENFIFYCSVANISNLLE